MHRICLALGLCGLLFASPTNRVGGQQNAKAPEDRQAGQSVGDPARGRTVSGSDRASGVVGPGRKVRVRLRLNNAPAAARVSIVGTDGKRSI